VRLYLLPGTLIGSFPVGADGSYSGSVPVPVGLPLGAQTLQANGFAPSGAVRSVSLGVQVVPVRQAVSRRSSAQVFFAPLSPELTAQGRRALDALVRKAGKTGQRAVVVGFVQQTSSTNNDQSLSTLRAQNVAAYLKARGLPGSYQVRGDGVAGPGNNARRVNITVTYQPGC
jgi:outer membrane protein OmpA-like peptidoglycan-associated protein